ncbi:MAG: peptidoglycan D,D-transpeptidase FtsI family protein [Bacteroidia bacterium]
MNPNPNLASRKFLIGGFFILVALVYIGRLFYMQLVDKHYEEEAQRNALQEMTEYPPRGVIFDRNGQLLVANEPSYDLMVTPKLAKGCDTMGLCEILQITKEDFLKRIKKACQAPNSPRRQSVFEKQMSQKVNAAVQEKLFRFAGFYVQSRTVRTYPRAVAAHLLGYVGEVTKEKSEKDTYYKEGDYIGVSGIERSYEEALRGVNGKRYVVKDVHNKAIGRYMEGKYDSAAVIGKPLYSTIDVELQEYVETLLKGKKGALVAIEPATGEILCMVSAPSYDPNLLIGGKERARNFGKLSTDSAEPLINRALQGMYPPGSVFKLINALIGLQDGVIGREASFPCAPGYAPMGGHPRCHKRHSGNLVENIAQSCNAYFSYVFTHIVDQKKYPKFKDGYAHWRDQVMTFGPNTSLGTDLPFDKPGNVPSIKYYDKVFGPNGWRSNTIVSLGIGQAELTLVPLQMANIMATIANRGYYYIPHCIKGVGNEKYLDPKFREKHFVGVQDTSAYRHVIDGMQRCFDAGTGYPERIPGIVACGKTGTAENPHGNSHAVFLAFAPRDNPKIAVACLIENAGWGGVWAAPAVSLLMEKYLTGKVTRIKEEERYKAVDLINRKNLLSTESH